MPEIGKKFIFPWLFLQISISLQNNLNVEKRICVWKTRSLYSTGNIFLVTLRYWIIAQIIYFMLPYTSCFVLLHTAYLTFFSFKSLLFNYISLKDYCLLQILLYVYSILWLIPLKFTCCTTILVLTVILCQGVLFLMLLLAELEVFHKVI